MYFCIFTSYSYNTLGRRNEWTRGFWDFLPLLTHTIISEHVRWVNLVYGIVCLEFKDMYLVFGCVYFVCECLKGVKGEVKQARRAQSWPESPSARNQARSLALALGAISYCRFILHRDVTLLYFVSCAGAPEAS